MTDDYITSDDKIDVSTPEKLADFMVDHAEKRRHVIPWSRMDVSRLDKKRLKFIQQLALPNEYAENDLVRISAVAFVCLWDGKFHTKQWYCRPDDGSMHFFVGVGRFERIEIGNLELWFKDTQIVKEHNITRDLKERCLDFINGVKRLRSQMKRYLAARKSSDYPITEFTMTVPREKVWKMDLIQNDAKLHAKNVTDDSYSSDMFVFNFKNTLPE